MSVFISPGDPSSSLAVEFVAAVAAALEADGPTLALMNALSTEN